METTETAALKQQNAALVTALKDLCRSYVWLLEGGRDRILELGGDCDPVDVMEASCPELLRARAEINRAEGAA